MWSRWVWVCELNWTCCRALSSSGLGGGLFIVQSTILAFRSHPPLASHFVSLFPQIPLFLPLPFTSAPFLSPSQTFLQCISPFWSLIANSFNSRSSAWLSLLANTHVRLNQPPCTGSGRFFFFFKIRPSNKPAVLTQHQARWARPELFS